MNALTLPDIAAQASRQALPLDWVGMCGIALPILIDGQRLTATADAGVSLDDGTARGIHMSRLYLALEMLDQQPVTPAVLRNVLQRFLDSHEDLSKNAYLRLHTNLLLKRPALVSPLAGWKGYPVSIEARLENQMFHVELKIDVTYSSTCPCSAALARQLIQQQFIQDFGNTPLQHEDVLTWLGSANGIVATPHSQRSSAQLRVQFGSHLDRPVGDWLGYPVVNPAHPAEVVTLRGLLSESRSRKLLETNKATYSAVRASQSAGNAMFNKPLTVRCWVFQLV